MVLIVVVAGPIGWEANRVARMRRAVAVLERPVAGERPGPDADRPPPTDEELAPRNRVEVAYDEVYRDGKIIAEPRLAWVPRWFREGVGEDHFRRVTRVHFQRRPEAADWEAIAGLGTVIGLDLSETETDDDDLTGLERCPDLQALDLTKTKITDESLVAVGRLRDLRVLSLWSTNTTDGGLTPLTSLTRLERLTLGADAVTDAGFRAVAGLTNLRSLGPAVPFGGVTDAGLAQLQRLTNLEELSFGAWGVTDAGIAHLAALPNLRMLQITNVYAAPGYPPPFGPGPNESIDAKPWITRAGFEQVGRLGQIRTLDLSGPTRDADLRAVGRLTQLRQLVLGGGSEVSDDGLASLTGLDHLESLVLGCEHVTDAGLVSLGKLTELRTLMFIGTPISDAGLVHLRPLTKLILLAPDDRVTDEGIAQLRAALPNLRSIIGR